MSFIRYTAKKILIIAALSNTLVPMVKTYIRAGVIIESVIDCVRWASLACPGAFYIYENFLKNFWRRNGYPATGVDRPAAGRAAGAAGRVVPPLRRGAVWQGAGAVSALPGGAYRQREGDDE